MDIRKRKISFNYLIVDSQESDYEIFDELRRMFQFAMEREKADRKLNLNNSKFCILQSCSLNNDQSIHKLIFKSAIHSYRAPLLDRETVDERENPKTLSEGETQKTHFLIKYENGDAILLAERFRGGLVVQQLVQYLNWLKKMYEDTRETPEASLNYRFDYEIIAKDNIDEELESMSRVVSTSIYVDKQLLGSDALNFSQRLETVQESIIIDVRASRTESIKQTARDILAKFNGGSRVVKKVRIKGKNSTNNDITIDTSFIEKREYVEAQLNEDTGEVNSSYLMSQLDNIASTL